MGTEKDKMVERERESVCVCVRVPGGRRTERDSLV